MSNRVTARVNRSRGRRKSAEESLELFGLGGSGDSGSARPRESDQRGFSRATSREVLEKQGLRVTREGFEPPQREPKSIRVRPSTIPAFPAFHAHRLCFLGFRAVT